MMVNATTMLATLLDIMAQSFKYNLTIIAVKEVVTWMELMCEIILSELISKSSRT
jgi:hypothetical protein